LELSLKKAIENLFPEISPADIPHIYLEIPKNKTHGDLSSNIAMRIAKFCGRNPKEVAGNIQEYLVKNSKKEFEGSIKNIEVQLPGFINFFFARQYLYETLKIILKKKDKFGKTNIGKGKKIQIEFVSANPTGPLSVAHARQAAVGDALANIFQFLRFNITREYYVNDEGIQIELLGKSIKARYDELLGEPAQLPEQGYRGDYVYDIAKEIISKKAKGKIDFSGYGVKYLLGIIKEDLKKFNIKIDTWFYQSALTKKGEVKRIVQYLRKKNLAYDKDEAVWFASSEFGDDKDRVLIKRDGSFTYLAPDIAYHQNKYNRGFERIINIWGPDHHGYIPRLKAAVKALGKDEDSLSVIIVQLATIYKDGKPIRMSTRAGEYITLREVIDEVGIDTSRFFFLMRRTNSHLAFDLDLAKKQSLENPVYYIQYAHARISNIISKAGGASLNLRRIDFSLLKQAEEIDIIKLLVRFPLALEICLQLLDPYSLVDYLQELATSLHRFYDSHRVIGEDEQLSKARLALIEATRVVLANGLRLLGLSTPDKM
ncbi:MAG: arginine--tRNA ligase, partial [Candidatus Omnitrophica bacterium]|nr:arginine--tRNA ligase [Candidatus Omnitrophota bacterium]